jgi:SAM-dependent methyltransferase
MKQVIQKIPILGPLAYSAARRLFGKRADREFSTSADYWEQRYQSGGDSGRGSYNQLAEFKARVLTEFVDKHSIRTVIEFGCGDGNQVLLAKYPSYLGLDVSQTAVDRCRRMFAGDPTKSFQLMDDYRGERADLSMSLDVVYHLVEDAVFGSYMARLFDAGERFVVVYATNYDTKPGHAAPHVRHRRFTDWIEKHRPRWTLTQFVPNEFPFDEKTGEGSPADFYFYRNKFDRA